VPALILAVKSHLKDPILSNFQLSQPILCKKRIPHFKQDLYTKLVKYLGVRINKVKTLISYYLTGHFQLKSVASEFGESQPLDLPFY
jgi:hypothetical protein